MINFIDNLLNKITMYRLVLYYLILLVLVAAIFGGFGLLPFNPLSLILSALIVLVVCWIANLIFAKAFKAPANFESVYITALILSLIISPITFRPFDVAGFWFLAWASVFAMASKYILAINKKHIFNPAAFAVAVTAIALNQYASWWVGGNLPMLAFVVIGGLLVVRKIQRFDLVLSFFVAALASIIATNPSFDPINTAERALIHTSIFFFGFIMLTEPLTTPPTRPLRIAYGAFVGLLFSPAIHIGPVYSTPELALIAGNVLSYAMSPKGKFMMKFKSKEEVGADTYDFAFEAEKKITFRPGQYMEWTLAHAKSDSRGNRRYFTIASSPTENDLHLGVKFYDNSSSFKKKLLSLAPSETIMGGQLAGDFVLPKDKNKKLVFIAGGIGITPFRSMAKYLSDSGERRDVILLYSNRSASEIAYREVFDEAEQTIGMKTIYAITDDGHVDGKNFHRGRIDADLIKREIPDYRERMFYISGTHSMVVSFKKTLHELGIPLSQIKTDFFPGF